MRSSASDVVAFLVLVLIMLVALVGGPMITICW